MGEEKGLVYIYLPVESETTVKDRDRRLKYEKGQTTETSGQTSQNAHENDVFVLKVR